jgi:hypothetical protein
LVHGCQQSMDIMVRLRAGRRPATQAVEGELGCWPQRARPRAAGHRHPAREPLEP